MSSEQDNIKTMEIVEEPSLQAPVSTPAPTIETAPRATKLRQAKEKKAKEPKEKSTKKVTRPKREVHAVEIKPVDKQKKWEQRGYMREEGESPETVRHKSKFGIKEAFVAGFAYMKKMFVETGKTRFDVSEVVHACHSTGPAYGDCFRNTFKKEANSKHPLVNYHLKKGKGRPTYEVVLSKHAIENFAVEKAALIAPQEIPIVAPIQ